MPSGTRPAAPDEALAWVRSTRVAEPVVHRFRWQFRDQAGAIGGRGSARITPGDSLRFDVAGPLGSGRGAAFVSGDTALWAEPEEEVRKLVPHYPLLWAMLGVARLPIPVGEVSRFEDERLTAWRFVHGADTTEYAWVRDSEVEFIADVRQGGERIGLVRTRLTTDGRLRSSRLDVPGTARLDITYVSSTIANGFPADTWSRPGS